MKGRPLVAKDRLSRSEEARANAAVLFTKQFTKARQAEAAVWQERAMQRQAEGEKMLRLRALRLEKEAADMAPEMMTPKPVSDGKRSPARATKLKDGA